MDNDILIDENKKLKGKLYNLVLANKKAPYLKNNIHRVHYFLITVINDKSEDDESKLETLKKYLSEMLVCDPYSILESIDNLRDDLPEDSVIFEFERIVKKSIGSSTFKGN